MVGVALIAAHGLRGIAVLVVLMLAVSVPRTRAWYIAEGALVRLTGSRKRAAILVLSTIIVAFLAIDAYSLFHS